MLLVAIKQIKNDFNPLTSGTDYIRFLHFLLAYCISAFKRVEDIKWHKSAGI